MPASPRLYAPLAVPLGMYDPDHGGASAAWRINGYRATIVVWTAEEWARLTELPSDAQRFANGCHAALRVE